MTYSLEVMLTVTLGHVAAFTSGVFYLIIEDVA
jgi:hypothetical protein